MKRTYSLIWQAVKKIPRGKVATYGQIARVAGMDGQARLVGYALHNIPHGMEIPWHRVINSKGMISLPRLTGGYERQKKLLQKEKIMLRSEKVDLKIFGWKTTRKVWSTAPGIGKQFI